MAQQQLKRTEDGRKAQWQATEVAETMLPKLKNGDLGGELAEMAQRQAVTGPRWQNVCRGPLEGVTFPQL